MQNFIQNRYFSPVGTNLLQRPVFTHDRQALERASWKETELFKEFSAAPWFH